MHVLKHNQQQVNTALENYFHIFLSQKKTILIQAMRYSVLLGGKRLRPFLLYQTGQLFDLPPSSLNAAASAIECIHAYSLVHDDIPHMDNDILRRGLPACHVKFGETTAILAGNALQTLAFSILSSAKMPKVLLSDRLKMISTLASASGANGMCLGQSLDLIKSKKISIEHLEKIHRNKTGALIHAAVRMGVLAAGKRARLLMKYLDCFSHTIGLAFQVQDDILDMTSNKKQTSGRQKGTKKKIGNMTYPDLIGLEMARKKAQDLYNESVTYLQYISELGYDTTILMAIARYIIEREE